MNNHLEHPGEEILERFLLHQSAEDELETVETHILACDSCVARLESLEIEVAATKLALQELHLRETARTYAAAQRKTSWHSWLTTPKLAVAGGVAALALGLLIVPRFGTHSAAAADVNLIAYRGLETPVVPKSHPLHVNLNAEDLNESQVLVVLVDSLGKEEWRGTTSVAQDHAVVTIPQIPETGEHYLRLYPTLAGKRVTLLREFAFQVK